MAVPDRHEALHRSFRWQVPARFNIGEACATRWARRTPEAAAVRWRDAQGQRAVLTYGALDADARRLATALARLGVRRGDRVALVLPQRPEGAIAHMAIYRLGAIAMPLSQLFGPDALAFRLQDSEAAVVIADAAGLAALEQLPPAVRSALRCVIGVGDADPSAGGGSTGVDAGWARLVREASPQARAAATAADEPAVLIYTSGTTGAPKGALIPHRALIGNLSGFVCSQNWFPTMAPSAGADAPQEPVFWSPADWAWTGGLMDALLPTLYFGRTIVADRARFEPQRALALMAEEGVTHTFLFPTALKAIMKAAPSPRAAHRLVLRSVMSAGESLGGTVRLWAREALGVEINEMFGQTEVNYLVGQCGRSLDAAGREAPGWAHVDGTIGKAFPGHRVAIVDEQGRPCAPGETGEIAVHRLDRHGAPDPIFFLGYWRQSEAARAKFTGDPATSWFRTGDLGSMDADGNIRYEGRADDLFKAAGYRIGPSEVENSLLAHPAVANAAVVPKPDADRGAIVKAFVVLAPGHVGDDALVQALQQHVRGRLAPYEYPKEIEFLDQLPMTATGKVQRRVLRLAEEARARVDHDGNDAMTMQTPPTHEAAVPTPLLRADELMARLTGPNPPQVLDATFELTDKQAGRRLHREGRIPGARFVDLEADLSAAPDGRNGRHPLPTREAARDALLRAGWQPGRATVVYGRSPLGVARAWWMLNWLGAPDVQVLDGGWAAWMAAGGGVEQGEPAAAPVAEAPRALPAPRAGFDTIDHATLRAGLDAADAPLVVDARGADRFRGENETLDPVGGHIPGSVNRPFGENFQADGRFRPADELRRAWSERLAGRAPSNVVASCGSGVSACHNLLSMHLAGMAGARLYAGSWSEWSAQPGAPVATGPEGASGAAEGR